MIVNNHGIKLQSHIIKVRIKDNKTIELELWDEVLCTFDILEFTEEQATELRNQLNLAISLLSSSSKELVG